jgi:hypothetical protein
VSPEPSQRRSGPAPWDENWRRDGKDDFRGGQGISFLATAKGGSGRRAFIKTLKRKDNAQARARFRREVTAYETLDSLGVSGVPRLFDHNAHEWRDRGVAM